MKKLLGFLIPVCIISFICFGVSSMFLPRSGYSVGNPIYDDKKYVFEGVVNTDRNWRILDEFPTINLNSSGVKTIVNQHDGNDIIVSASVPSGRNVYVGAYYDDDQLTIETSRDNVSFSDIVDSFGKVLWSEDIFTYSDGVVVTVSFPKSIYDYVNIKLGSGELYVDELYAKNNDIRVGSGTLQMSRSKRYVSEYLAVNIGSGNVKIKEYHSNNFNVYIGSGKCEISGLEGYGTLDMGSGKCKLITNDGLSRFSGDIGSGNLELYVAEGGAQITASVGSGSVNVNAYGVEEKVSNSTDECEQPIIFGNAEATIDIELGSGKVTILPCEQAPDIQINIPKMAATDKTDSAETVVTDSVDVSSDD